MTIARRLQRLLDSERVDFEVVPHERTATSQESAEAAHVSGEQLAKAVLLGSDSSYVLAVVPATHRVDPAAVEHLVHQHVMLANEKELERVFNDCDRGAVPAVGRAYGLETVVDDTLLSAPSLCFEAGDHESLLRVDQPTFRNLMRGFKHGRISYHN